MTVHVPRFVTSLVHVAVLQLVPLNYPCSQALPATLAGTRLPLCMTHNVNQIYIN